MTFDATKLRKQLTEKLSIPVGFSDPKIWISTGNYALNRLISGDYNRGVPLSKVTMFAGEQSAGKSLLAANVMKSAQEDYDAFVILLDSEGAGDEIWYNNAGVDTSPDKFIRIPVHTVTSCTNVVATTVKELVVAYPEKPFLFVIDSVGMLETETGHDKFMKGETPGDQGQLAKQLKKFIKGCIYLVEQKNVGFLVTNHTYDSMDMFNPDQKITGGNGVLYACSIVIAMQKAKLKDTQAKKVSENQKTVTSTGVHGIRTTAMVYKSRFSKPFEKTSIEIPWNAGVNPYSGLFELFKQDGILTQPTGGKYFYADKTGKEYKYFEKDIPNDLFDIIMKENPAELSREESITASSREVEMEMETADEGE
jgi:RecA/RadA recombinase